jgi:hypothetical protein
MPTVRYSTKLETGPDRQNICRFLSGRRQAQFPKHCAVWFIGIPENKEQNAGDAEKERISLGSHKIWGRSPNQMSSHFRRSLTRPFCSQPRPDCCCTPSAQFNPYRKPENWTWSNIRAKRRGGTIRHLRASNAWRERRTAYFTYSCFTKQFQRQR